MREITNDEAVGLLNILTGMKVCVPGAIPPPVTDKLIDLICELQEAAAKLQKRVDMIREQTRPEGVLSPQEASEAQRVAWNDAMNTQVTLLMSKAAEVKVDPLTPDEFRQAISASTLTGAQAVLLRRVLVDKKEGGGDE